MQSLRPNQNMGRTEVSFDISEPFANMQRGLPAAYPFTDYIYVVGDWANSDKLAGFGLKNFKSELGQVIVSNYKKHQKNIRTIEDFPQIPQLLISSFDTQLWNTISSSSVKSYRPAWSDHERAYLIHPQFSKQKKQFYKFDIKILFQVKKLKKGQNCLTSSVERLLKNYGLNYYKIEGESKKFCEAANSIMAGRFDDSVEKPKDPFSFYLHCLIGYDYPQHLGGTYLIAQKCVLDWNNIHAHNQSLSGVIGRNDINGGSNIFSQHHCPKSHIRISRIKDSNGNPVSPYRDSKTFTTSSFNPEEERGITDNINPQQGLFFIAYHKNPFLLEKIILHQLGNNANQSYEDSLLSMFRVDNGNILYTPNIQELTDLSINHLQAIHSQNNLGVLSAYHQINWLRNYSKKIKDVKRQKQTNNPYYLYSRAAYMVKMSEASPILNPPSSKTLRILSKTFELWQDTWYYDRKQKQLEHLSYFLKEKPEVVDALEEQANEIGFSLSQYLSQKGDWNYESIPMAVRNGLAIHYTLGHVLSTYLYGCRGPVDGTPNGCFGANTFHLEPEDVLAGGETNCTFGQGKHVIEYLTERQMQASWKNGLNLSAHSGIGHVVPYMQDIMNEGLASIIAKFKNQAKKYSTMEGQSSKVELFVSSVFALLGMQQYFINYANYASNYASSLQPSEQASIRSLKKIEETMRHLSTDAPRNLHEAAQLVLSTFVCLHISGEPVSIGRLDYVLRKFAKPVDPNAKEIVLDQEDQDVIDSFWIKVGEKPNFNKSFFEDHSKWGNLAFGGSSSSYPQGASFNQWGQQLTIGGSNPDNSPFYNSITVHCLRSARTIPTNAPCLGFRILPSMPKNILEEAAKAILSGGAHPILLNEDKIIEGFRRSGNYVIPKQLWDSTPLYINQQLIEVPYNHWKTTISEEHIRDFTSDGCYEFLISGRSWFWLGGCCSLQPLEYVLNRGHTLLTSGPRFIHGNLSIYRDRPLNTITTYEQLEEEYLSTFQDLQSNAFFWQFQGYGNLTKVCPATLLNAFTATTIERGSDFYDNGTEYKLFCPQYTGLANLINSLWNIKQLVFQKKVTNLQEVRFVLLVNWGDQLGEPFVSASLPVNMRERIKNRCDMLRELVWKEPKFGLNRQVTEFGLRITKRMSQIVRNIFQNPEPRMVQLFKSLTYKHGSASAPFGIQYLPGCGTFENFVDFGTNMGASFDGRKKSQSIAQDYSPQNYLIDKSIGDKRFQFDPVQTIDVIDNYTYRSGEKEDPELMSGAVLDLNIDESYDYATLVQDISQLAQGKGTNLTTITCCSRPTMQEFRNSVDRDLVRFRMGGWSQFAISMFNQILEQQVRRVREIPSNYPLYKMVKETEDSTSCKAKQ